MTRKSATSYKQTKQGILPRHEVITLEIIGTKQGLLILKRLSSQNKRITQDLIKELHRRCFSEILLDEAGKFRVMQVMYSGKEAPHFSKIPEMIKNLCEDTEHTIKHLPKRDDRSYINRIVELLVRFQHRFVFIHPFVEYNGRTDRLLTSYILMRLNLPIIEIKADKGDERKRYIKALQKADDGDYEKLENIM